MATSTVPAAVDALLTILQADPGLDAVDVVDGPPGPDLTNGDRIHIGYRPSGDVAVQLQQSFNAAGARTRDETFTINGYIESRSGDTDMAEKRVRVYALLAEIENALRATTAVPTAPTLNGTVLWAELTTGSLIQAQTTSGALAGLDFTVHCRARI